MRISFIVTVYNEEKSLPKLLDSLLNQSVLPNEIVIVDAFSRDDTDKIVREYQAKFERKTKKINFLYLKKRGNRSHGRNLAIRKSSSEIIVITDAGCILDRNWIREITKPFKKKNVDVVAGYYEGIFENSFQEALIPYVLVMPERINKKNFLPATRSMAIKKDIFEKMKGFDQRLSHNEDYEFARRIQKSGYSIAFAKMARVKWIPRSNSKQAFIMFARFAYGDVESKIFRPKVLLIFVRLVGFLTLLGISIWNGNYWYILLALIVYALLAYFKNRAHVHTATGGMYLVYFQFLSDLAVIAGSVLGLRKLFNAKNKIFI